MRKTVLLIGILVYITCNSSKEPIRPLPHHTEKWDVRGGKYADKPILLRINRGLDSIADHAPLAFQAAASVVLKNPTEKGLLAPVEVEQLKKIEKLLTHRMVTTGIAVYGLRVETDNRCDFIFYTDNNLAADKTFNRIGKMVTDYRIDFSVKKDPKWITYRWFKSWE